MVIDLPTLKLRKKTWNKHKNNIFPIIFLQEFSIVYDLKFNCFVLELVSEFSFGDMRILKSTFIIKNSLQQKLFNIMDGYGTNLNFVRDNDDRSYFPLEEARNSIFFSFRFIGLVFGKIVKDILKWYFWVSETLTPSVDGDFMLLKMLQDLKLE